MRAVRSKPEPNVQHGIGAQILQPRMARELAIILQTMSLQMTVLSQYVFEQFIA